MDELTGSFLNLTQILLLDTTFTLIGCSLNVQTTTTNASTLITSIFYKTTKATPVFVAKAAGGGEKDV